MFDKKIALFISHIYGDYQRNLTQGIIDKALEYGYQTEVYTTNDGEDLGGLTETEQCILQLPAFDRLSGAIFASGTYASAELRSRISERLSASKLPVIEVNDSVSVFQRVTMDNNTMIGTLAEHFIKMHGAKRICYLGCKGEPDISDLRLSILRSFLEKNHLPFSEKDVYICDETPEDYNAALSALTENGTAFPDAILCYNDRLAYELIIAAESRGYKVPGDFGVSGADNTTAGQNMIPPLTTVSYPVYDLGQLAVDDLYALTKGKELVSTAVFAKVIYGGSCGCSSGEGRKIHLYAHALQSKIADLERSIIRTARVSSCFGELSEIEDSLDLIAEYTRDIENCTGFYLVLSADWNRLSERILTLTGSEEPEGAVSEDLMTLYLALQNGKRLPGCTFQKGTLLPDFLPADNENARIVSPVYHHGSSIGYVVMTFENNRIRYPFQLIQYLVNLSQLLDMLRNKKRSHAMSAHLEELYMRDSLTGLYNKAGFEYYRDRKVASGPLDLAVLFVDMNGLKKINDENGHDAGDFAIQVLGQAIHRALEEDALAGRIGGDEFLILLPGDLSAGEAAAKRIRSYLSNYGNVGSGNYSISASIGVAAGSVDGADALEALVKEADWEMYREKHKK
ncbi:MAG: GGDEF domain-containing protein [Lachnospiraceae bacterium]|nr:GGDEF domain-containing protein [Lachnospiraceae bacterium]